MHLHKLGKVLVGQSIMTIYFYGIVGKLTTSTYMGMTYPTNLFTVIRKNVVELLFGYIFCHTTNTNEVVAWLIFFLVIVN